MNGSRCESIDALADASGAEEDDAADALPGAVELEGAALSALAPGVLEAGGGWLPQAVTMPIPRTKRAPRMGAAGITRDR
jgi:hypothetical protein